MSRPVFPAAYGGVLVTGAAALLDAGDVFRAAHFLLLLAFRACF